MGRGAWFQATRSARRFSAGGTASCRGGSCLPPSALAALVLTGSASAAEITYTSVTGIWHDPVDNLPGSQPGDPVITNGTPTSIIRWGDTSGSQSGYDFTGRSRRPFTLPGPIPVLLSWVVYASQLRGRRSFADFGSARCRPRDQCRWRPTRSIDLYVYVQPPGNPEQPDAVSVSDTARRGVHGPRDDRRVTHAHDVQRRRIRLHVVDELSQQRQSGLRVHYERRRHDQQLGPRRRIYAAADPARHAGAQRRQIGPGDDESGGVGQFRHRRAERGDRRRVQRDTARSSAERPDGRHVRRHAASLERARVRGGRRDPGAGQRPSGPGDGLFARLQRRRVRAHVQHVDARVGDRRRRTPRDRVPRAARLGFSVRQRADERGRRDAVVQRRRHEPGPHRLHAHLDGRHRRHSWTTRTRTPSWSCRGCTPTRRRRCKSTAMSPGIVDAGDVLRYTIRIYNNGSLPFTAAALRDAVPANTTYVAGHADVERPTRRPARRWRVAAGRGSST